MLIRLVSELQTEPPGHIWRLQSYNLTFYKDKNVMFAYSYYADTFIYNVTASPPKWKQVLTHGFPT